MPDNNLLDLGDGPLTIEFFLKRSTTLGTLQTILNKGSTGYEVRLEPDNKITLRKSGTAASIAKSSVAIADQNWHHVMLTKNGATTAIYVDGADVTTAGTNATLADTVQILRVGFQAAASQRFVGTLDELAIYRDTLGAWCANDHWERRLSPAFTVGG